MPNPKRNYTKFATGCTYLKLESCKYSESIRYSTVEPME